MYKYYIKPLLDFLCALILIIILSPVFILIMILLAFTQQGKIFFKQERPGYKGKIFSLIKFKTMTDKRNASGELLPDMQRMHKTGSFLRKTSLDELPQLINVLKGEMSFVGPRPLLKEYLPLYSKEQQKRHDVKPGITGWAQVNGRNTISWQQKFELDTWYASHQSAAVDLKILLLTLKKIFSFRDVNAGEDVTMVKFKGNE